MAYHSRIDPRSSLVAQQVKDLLSSLLWYRFDPWPGNFHMSQVEQKKRKKKVYPKGIKSSLLTSKSEKIPTAHFGHF